MACSVSAQQSAQEEIFNIRFATLSTGAAIDDIYYKDNGKPESFVVPNGNVSRFHKYVGPSPLILYRKEMSAENTVTYIPTAEILLPQNAAELLLLFSSEDGKSYHATPLKFSSMEFPKNSYRFYNSTKRPIAGQVGDYQFMVEPQSMETVKVGKREGRSVSMKMAAGEEDGKWKLVYSSRWAIKPDQRVLAFLVEDKRRSTGLRILKYYPPVEKANPLGSEESTSS